MRLLLPLCLLWHLAAAWLPGHKIRGVNLGTQFIFEPWISSDAWNDIGCADENSEFDCVLKLGQDAADEAFAKHWASWTTQDDITNMVDYGLNTIRIPVGYWMLEELVYNDSEHFPRGAFPYLEEICGWASDAGLYVIMDFHGLPGAQQPEQPFTGQFAPTSGFYEDYQYDRAFQFLEWMTENIHTNDKFRNVGMLLLVNEPVQNADEVETMRTNYYPNAFTRIREKENSLGVEPDGYLHIQMMNEKWGSGNPNEAISDLYYAAYDDHRYLKWDPSVPVNKDDYITSSCNDDRGGNSPTIVGEWSLSIPDDVEWNDDWNPNKNQDFYKKWFAAQVIAYEKQEGWVFWTWRAELGDYRWSYKDAVEAGVIPKDLDSVYDIGAC